MNDELRDAIAVELFKHEKHLEDINGYIDWVRVVNVVNHQIEAAGYAVVKQEAE